MISRSVLWGTYTHTYTHAYTGFDCSRKRIYSLNVPDSLLTWSRGLHVLSTPCSDPAPAPICSWSSPVMFPSGVSYRVCWDVWSSSFAAHDSQPDSSPWFYLWCDSVYFHSFWQLSVTSDDWPAYHQDVSQGPSFRRSRFHLKSPAGPSCLSENNVNLILLLYMQILLVVNTLFGFQFDTVLVGSFRTWRECHHGSMEVSVTYWRFVCLFVFFLWQNDCTREDFKNGAHVLICWNISTVKHSFCSAYWFCDNSLLKK